MTPPDCQALMAAREARSEVQLILDRLPQALSQPGWLNGKLRKLLNIFDAALAEAAPADDLLTVCAAPHCDCAGSECPRMAAAPAGTHTSLRVAHLEIALMAYMSAVKRLGTIKNGVTLFETSPSKDPEAFDAWTSLNDVTRAASEVLQASGARDALKAAVENVATPAAKLRAQLEARPTTASGEWKPTHQHYKGGYYRVMARGRIEADLSPVVIYDNEAGETWVRPVDDFDQRDPFVRFAALALPRSPAEKGKSE